jgi:hypothetical protein
MHFRRMIVMIVVDGTCGCGIRRSVHHIRKEAETSCSSSWKRRDYASLCGRLPIDAYYYLTGPCLQVARVQSEWRP